MPFPRVSIRNVIVEPEFILIYNAIAIEPHPLGILGNGFVKMFQLAPLESFHLTPGTNIINRINVHKVIRKHKSFT